jgi:Nuclease A inhibitor-like protein
MTSTDSTLIDSFKEAVDGLYYMSETDCPFEVLLWPQEQFAATPEKLRETLGKPQDSPVEERSLEAFLGRLAQEQDWQNEAERAIAQRFKTLLELITQNLTDTKVYRIGEIQIDIYIVGRATSGNWIVVMTQAVET